MKNIQRRERILTELDHVRLVALCGRGPKDRSSPGPGIDAVLDDARVVPSRNVDPDVVTMYSQVLLRVADDGTPRKLTLCYPEHAEPQQGFVSVYWASPDGTRRMAEVDAILFQPEASGDYTT